MLARNVLGTFKFHRSMPSWHHLRRRSISFLDKLFSNEDSHKSPRGFVGDSSAYQLAVLGYVSMTMYPKHTLANILENDPDFLMGHVLVGASQFLCPQYHEDSKDAGVRVAIASSLLNKGARDTIEHSPVLNIF